MKAIVRPGKTFEIDTPVGKRLRFAGHEIEVSEEVFKSNQDKLMTPETKNILPLPKGMDIQVKVAEATAELKSKLDVAEVQLKGVSEELEALGPIDKAKKEDLVNVVESIVKIIAK